MSIGGAVLTAVTLASAFWAVLAGLTGAVLGLVILFVLFWLFTPQEMDKAQQHKQEAIKKELLEERKRLYRVAAIAVRDHDRYIDSLRADFKGVIQQVYIDDPTFDPHLCFFVTINLDLWNVREAPAIIQKFVLVLYSSIGTFTGRQASLVGIVYAAPSRLGVQVLKPIESQEMPKSAQPRGYMAGHREPDRWLRFRVSGFSLDEIRTPAGESLQSLVSDLDLLILDGDGRTHFLQASTPWTKLGEVENTHCLHEPIDDETAHAIFAECHANAHEFLEECRSGRLPSKDRLKMWIQMTAQYVRDWRGTGYQTEFNRCPDRPTEEMNNWTPGCKALGAFLNPRMEKLAEYIREIRSAR